MMPPQGGFFDSACELADVAHALRGEGFDASEDGTGRGTPLVPIAIQGGAIRENAASGPDGVGVREDGIAYTLEARSEVQAVAFVQNSRDEVRVFGGDGHTVGALAAESGMKQQTYVAFRTAGDGNTYEEGDRVAPLTTATDPCANIIAFSSKDHGADAGELSPTLRSMGHDQSHPNGGGQVAVAIRTAQTSANGHGVAVEQAHTLDGANGQAIAWSEELTPSVELAGTIQRGGDGGRHEGVMTPAMAVRRLTPRECERLQGFPDDYTKISEKTADGPRYKALGNSMAVPVMRWIGERIDMVEALSSAD